MLDDKCLWCGSAEKITVWNICEKCVFEVRSKIKTKKIPIRYKKRKRKKRATSNK